MFSDVDKRMFKALVHVLETGRYSLSGKEALAFSKVYDWVTELEKRANEPAKIKKEPIRGNKRK